MLESSSSSHRPRSLVSRRELRLMLGLLGLLAALLLLGGLLPRMAGVLVLAGWLLLWLPLLGLLFWRRRMKRRASLMVYLRKESPWQHRLRGGAPMLLGQALVSGVLALALLVALARGIPPATWMVLVLCVPVWAKAWSGLGRYLDRHASTAFLSLTVGRVLVWTFGMALLLGLAIRALWQPVPDLGDVTLYEAVLHFAVRQEAESPALRRLLAVAGALDGARHWLMQHWLDGLPGLVPRLIAWMVVLVREWLFVWPFLLLCEALSQVIYRHEHQRYEPVSSGA